jgi:transposase-like protein
MGTWTLSNLETAPTKKSKHHGGSRFIGIAGVLESDSRGEKVSKVKLYLNSQKRMGSTSKIYDRDYLYDSYVTKKKTMATIAKENGVSSSTVMYWLIKFGINNVIERRGKDSRRWSGGRPICSGYVHEYVGMEDGKTKYKAEHRRIAEQAMGRELKKNEIVHHINTHPADNRNSNLLICDYGYHRWLHNEMSRRYAEEKFGGL